MLDTYTEFYRKITSFNIGNLGTYKNIYTISLWLPTFFFFYKWGKFLTNKLIFLVGLGIKII